jgi:hypothetical protein
MRKFRWISAAALLAGMAILGATPAQASLMLTIDQGAGNSATATMDTTTGIITPLGGSFTGTASGTFTDVINVVTGDKTLSFTGTVGTVFFDLSTAATTNTPGTTSLAKLTLASATITNLDGGGKTFDIISTATGYTAPSAPPSPGVMGFISTSGTIVNGTLSGTFSGSADTTYTPAAIVLGPVNGPGSLAETPPGTFIPVFPSSSPFSMTSTFTATLSANASTASLGGAVVITAVPVPEPSTVAAALTGVGLVGLGTLRRKFRNRA